MLAKKYKSELISIINPFEGIYRLVFKSFGRAFKYQPSQFLHLVIDEDYDGIGLISRKYLMKLTNLQPISFQFLLK